MDYFYSAAKPRSHGALWPIFAPALITVFYFTYPKELHWVSTPADRIDSWQKELAFLEHYINPKIGMTSTSTDEVAFPKSTVVTGPAK